MRYSNVTLRLQNEHQLRLREFIRKSVVICSVTELVTRTAQLVTRTAVLCMFFPTQVALRVPECSVQWGPSVQQVKHNRREIIISKRLQYC